MNFRDRLLMDLDAVFLSPANFGTAIRIEGVAEPVSAIVEDVALDYPEYVDGGLRSRNRRVSLATKNLPPTTELGRALIIDDQEWIVQNKVDEEGMTILTLSKEIY